MNPMKVFSFHLTQLRPVELQFLTFNRAKNNMEMAFRKKGPLMSDFGNDKWQLIRLIFWQINSFAEFSRKIMSAMTFSNEINKMFIGFHDKIWLLGVDSKFIKHIYVYIIFRLQHFLRGMSPHFERMILKRKF